MLEAELENVRPGFYTAPDSKKQPSTASTSMKAVVTKAVGQAGAAAVRHARLLQQVVGDAVSVVTRRLQALTRAQRRKAKTAAKHARADALDELVLSDDDVDDDADDDAA